MISISLWNDSMRVKKYCSGTRRPLVSKNYGKPSYNYLR